MTELSEASYEELSREVEKRLSVGMFDFLGLYSTNQQNYRAAWDEVMNAVHELCLHDFDKYQPLRQLMLDAMDRHQGERRQEMRKVYAINTTFHGREANEDHSPQEAT